MKMRLVLLIVFFFPFSAIAVNIQIDSFDDISGWSGGVIVQGTAPADPAYEGTGSLVCDYTPYSTDNYLINKSVSLDLSAGAGDPGATINLWMWVGKGSVTARLDSLKFETSSGNHFLYDPTPGDYTLPIGWNEVVILQSDFAVNGTPDWSNITKIEIATTCYDDTIPTDVLFDDLRLVFDHKCHIFDLNNDCEFDLTDLAIMAGCWLVDCSGETNNPCCDWR